jgi:hypothetical protein
VADLSPAAQAVLDAAYREMDYAPRRHVQWVTAAALQAAVDQVVPEQSEPPCGESEPWPQSYQLMADSKWEQRQKTRTDLHGSLQLTNLMSSAFGGGAQTMTSVQSLM